MRTYFLKTKLHRATITDADLNYEGSVSIDPKLCDIAGLHKYEKVEIYNCNNGQRFSTYVIHGKDKEVCLNGAAARMAQKGDKVIICSYVDLEESEIRNHTTKAVLMTDNNEVKEVKTDSVF